jgi:hypothetical protein
VRRKKRTHAAPAPLVADGGLGAELLAHAHDGIRTCSPTALPPGYRWPEPAARAYTLARHPAIALYATAGGGQSILWMYTTWHDPPILDSPSATLTRRGRRYAIYTEHGRVREIAWSIGATRAWITNTLESSLGNAEMIALAESCRG